MQRITPRYWAIIGLVLTNLFWAGNIFVSKILVDEVPPFTLNVLRWLITFVILTPFALKPIVQAWPIIKKSWLQLSVYGFLGVTVYNACLYTSAYTTAGINIAVISTITPLLTFVFAWCFFGDKPNSRQAVGFSLAIIGVLVLISKGSLATLLSLGFAKGDLWMLLACISWAIYTAYLIKKPKGLSVLVFIYTTTFLGIIFALPSSAMELMSGEIDVAINTTTVLSVLYAGIFPSLVSYILFNYGVSVLGSQTTSLSAYLIPVFTAIVGVLFLGESVQWFHIISQFLVFLGFYFSLMKS